jgi:hypothetical protein
VAVTKKLSRTQHNDQTLWNCTSPEKANPFQGIDDLSKFWSNPSNTNYRQCIALNGLYWICGKQAYTVLPSNWKGSCTIGMIQPGFFLLPKQKGEQLGVPVFQDLGKIKRQKRDLFGLKPLPEIRSAQR